MPVPAILVPDAIQCEISAVGLVSQLQLDVTALRHGDRVTAQVRCLGGPHGGSVRGTSWGFSQDCTA
jgi:hypothetical protein